MGVLSKKMDLQRLSAFDYLIVHTQELGGPPSLHPDLPYKEAELLVRRNLVERGLLLMISRYLVERHASSYGIEYLAGDYAHTFVTSLETTYSQRMVERAMWLKNNFEQTETDQLRELMNKHFGKWVAEFQQIDAPFIQDNV